jgi:hypothetical protein
MRLHLGHCLPPYPGLEHVGWPIVTPDGRLCRTLVRMIDGLYASQLVDELISFMSDRFGWPSTLLRQGTIGLMEELAEAGVQTANGVLSAASFDDLKSQARAQFLEDPGLGSMQARGPLLAQIPRDAKEFTPSSFKYKSWIFAIPGLMASYIHSWRTEFEKPAYSDASGPTFTNAFTASDAASFLASHLFHVGLSGSYLSRWLDYRVRHDPASYNLDELMGQIEDLVQNGRGEFQILVALARPAQNEIRSLPGWMDAKSARRWILDNRLKAPRTIHGGVVYKYEQWDLDKALLSAAKAINRLRQRMILKTGGAPVFIGTVWIAGVKSPQRLPEISQLGRMLTPGYELGDPQVDAAASDNRLEVAVELLVAGLSEVGPSAAGTLWASLEALLAAPGDPDRIQVAHRAGDIALVALVRASMQRSLGLLFSRSAEENLTKRLVVHNAQDRLMEFEKALRRNDHETLAHDYTRLALSRTKRLLDADALGRNREELRQTLRGLYRQRNLVLHGGITDSPLLESILRSSAPLVTAIINRYARASSDQVVDPHIFAYEMLVRIEGYLADPRAAVEAFW